MMRQHRNDILSKNFSTTLLELRGSLSQAEFARKLGIPSQQTYQRYEKGLIPSGEILHQIASVVGVKIDDLLHGNDTQKNSEVFEKSEFLMKETPTPYGHEAKCLEYIKNFLKTCEGDGAKLGWTLVELHEKFPLNKWKGK